MPHTLTFAGTGDSMGVPRVYCTCDVCTEARSTGLNRRTRCSAVIKTPYESIWLDCGPDWRHQMERLRLTTASTVLITHAHYDHIGGIPELADMARWTKVPVRVLGPETALHTITTQFPWVGRHLAFEPVSGSFALPPYQVDVWEVCHGHNGRSHAYRFSRPGYTWAYVPDSISLTYAEQQPLHNLDLLVLGTAYYKEDAPKPTRSLYDMVEALTLLSAVRPRQAIFTHLSHGVDRRRNYGLPANVRLAHDGLSIPLGRT